MMRYSTNVDKLLDYGAFDFEEIPNYLELGFTSEDIPALLELVNDWDVLDKKKEPISSAPYHALYTLGQLKAEQAVLPLLTILDELDVEDWLSEDVMAVLILIGEKVIPPVQEYLLNPDNNEFTRAILVEVFEEISKNHPECREQCIAILIDCLAQITVKESEVASSIVCSLINLNVKESINEIRAAFERGCIDISIPGDLEEVEIEMGFRAERSTPKPDYHGLGDISFDEILKRTLNVHERKPDSKDNRKPVSKPKPIEQVIKVGRNDPCPCGSGKKYKKCCLY